MQISQPSSLHRNLNYLLIGHHLKQGGPLALDQPSQLGLNIIGRDAALRLDAHGFTQLDKVWVLICMSTLINDWSATTNVIFADLN